MKRMILAVLTVSVFVAASLAAGGVADAKKMKHKMMKSAKMSASDACLAKGKMVGRDEQRTFVVSDCMKGMK